MIIVRIQQIQQIQQIYQIVQVQIQGVIFQVRHHVIQIHLVLIIIHRRVVVEKIDVCGV